MTRGWSRRQAAERRELESPICFRVRRREGDNPQFAWSRKEWKRNREEDLLILFILRSLRGDIWRDHEGSFSPSLPCFSPLSYLVCQTKRRKKKFRSENGVQKYLSNWRRGPLPGGGDPRSPQLPNLGEILSCTVHATNPMDVFVCVSW